MELQGSTGGPWPFPEPPHCWGLKATRRAFIPGLLSSVAWRRGGAPGDRVYLVMVTVPLSSTEAN